MATRWTKLVGSIAFAWLASQPVSAAPRITDYAADVRSWQAHDTRLLSIGWRLARANAPFCSQRRNSIGLMLTDFHRFEKPTEVSAALGIASGVALEAVASGSPAEAAGLRPGEALLAVGGEAVIAPTGRLPKGKRLADHLHDRIDAALDRRGAVSLRVARRGEAPRDVTIAGKSVCRARFALLSSGTAAMSEGFQIKVAVQLMAEHPSDDEAATMLAHELAHNALDHVAKNNAAGRNYLTVRRNEREADRLAPWLMANAGFDPAAAPRFMGVWGPRHGGGITRSPSHDGWRDRVEDMAGELPAIARAVAAQPGQPLDWRVQFASVRGE
jgi:hypothetical protein